MFFCCFVWEFSLSDSASRFCCGIWFFASSDNEDIMAAIQQPLLWWNFLLLVGVAESGEYTSVICAKTPSYCFECFTRCRWRKPTRQRSIPSDTKNAAIADSSFPSAMTWILRKRTTTSSASTDPHMLCLLHDLPCKLCWSQQFWP